MSSTTPVPAADGTRIMLRHWEPAGSIRASVFIIHGLGEHSGRYEHVGRHLAGLGFLVQAPDLRGFGASGGPRARVDRVDTYFEDLAPLVAAARRPALPLALWGHSMGGLIALCYAQARGGVDLMVLTAPSLDADISTAKRMAARSLRRLLPGLAMPNGIRGEQLAADPAVGEAYFADPLVVTRTTAALGGALLEAMSAARCGGVPVPTLVLHGGDDTLVPPRASEVLATAPMVKRIVLPGYRHEIHNEKDGLEALQPAIDWLNAGGA